MKPSRELAELLAQVRTTYLPSDVFAGGVPTLATYGHLADETWQAFERVDEDLGDAMRRDPTTYEPISAFVVSQSTAANVYVAARRWVKKTDPPSGVQDLLTFSTGPAVARYLSGFTEKLVGNPYWGHINNIDPALREPYGYVEKRPGSWSYPRHHFDPVAEVGSTELPEALREAIANAIDKVIPV